MNIRIAPTYEVMSEQAAADLLALLQTINAPLICVASGASPAGLYQQLVKLVHSNNVDASSWKFVGLDEWMGRNEMDEGSCRWHLENQLFKPLGVEKAQVFFFDGKAPDAEKECEAAENFIMENGGIDVAILGIGLNGHVGMNEPGTKATIRSHVASIHPLTQQTGQKYFTTPQNLTNGLTLGLATLMDAKHLFLLASGGHKAEIISRVMADAPSEELPATLLRNHPELTVYLDHDAATLMQPSPTAMG